MNPVSSFFLILILLIVATNVSALPSNISIGEDDMRILKKAINYSVVSPSQTQAFNNSVHSIKIKLYPAQNIIGNGKQKVSFGLPLPPGVLVDIDKVKVINDKGKGVPIFKKKLADWLNMPQQSLLCEEYVSQGNPGLRSVLIQFEQEFINADPLSFSIKLNDDSNSSKDLSVFKEISIVDTIRVVNDGTYSIQKNAPGYKIYEPKVLVGIDPKYLACTNLTVLSGVSGAVNDLSKIDKAQNDFFYTTINEFFNWPVDAKQEIDFYSQEEPWLYDRGQTFFNLYIRNGNIDALREGLRAVQQLMQTTYSPEDCKDINKNYSCVGFFKLKNPSINAAWKDSKYSYSESFVTAYLLTGYQGFIDYAEFATEGVMKEISFDKDAAYTERHRANALLTASIYYELTHDKKVKDYIDTAVDSLYARQHQSFEGWVVGNNGLYTNQSVFSGGEVNGCFNYAPEPNGGQPVSFSPWMSSLLAHALLRNYQATSDNRIPQMLVKLAKCEISRGVAVSNKVKSHSGQITELLIPLYIAQSYGELKDLGGDDPWSNVEHAIDVAYPIALGAYFTTDAALKLEFIKNAQKLLKTHENTIETWTRNTKGQPIYRVAPSRKYSWQYKNFAGVSWVANKLVSQYSNNSTSIAKSEKSEKSEKSASTASEPSTIINATAESKFELPYSISTKNKNIQAKENKLSDRHNEIGMLLRKQRYGE